MRPYTALTERGQARRLRALAWAALQQYALAVTRLRLITNSLNGIFRVDTRTGEKYVLRLTRPESGHPQAHLTAEMDWLDTLARETSLGVPRPLPARNGALMVAAGAEGVPETRWCTLFTWVPGTDLAHHLSPDNLAKLGELAARLHAHALTYRPPAQPDLLRYDRVCPFPEPLVLFEPRFATLFPARRRAVYAQAYQWAQTVIERLKTSGEPPRIIHADLHQWNVRWWHGRLAPIDFEDLMWGWPVQDIGTTFYHLQDEPRYAAQRAAFQAGYTRHCAWPERYPGEIDAFIAARGLDLANFVLNHPALVGKKRVARFVAGVEKRLRTLLASQTTAA